MLINIPEEIAQELERRAQQQGITVGEVLKKLLHKEEAPATLADLAKNALEAGLASEQPVNTADNSREILKTEYADYLKRRMDDNDNHNR